MKIGILTVFNTGNYGGLLQAYATCRHLKQVGFDAEMINYSSESVKCKIRLSDIWKKGFFLFVVSVVEKLYYAPRMRKMRQLALSMTKTGELTRDELVQLNDKYDLFLAGSDQIWNLNLQDGDTSYFLDFVTDSYKKRSYGSSFGVSDFSEEQKKQIRMHLADYRAISVRETSGAKLVKDILGKDVPVVLDPTFLLDRKEWDFFVEEVPQNRKYGVFVYQMAHSGKLAVAAARVAKTLHTSIRYVPFPICGFCRCRISLGLSAQQWVAGIRDAQMVLTDSFHGMVFSLIFNRNFYYVVTSDTVKARMSRVETLLGKLGLTDRIVYNAEDVDVTKEIDYTAVNRILRQECALSRNILRDILVT